MAEVSKNSLLEAMQAFMKIKTDETTQNVEDENLEEKCRVIMENVFTIHQDWRSYFKPTDCELVIRSSIMIYKNQVGGA